MEKTKIFGTVLVVFSILIAGCGGCSDPPPQQDRPKPLNIIVILDTSNRISKEKTPNQVKTDITIAKGIVDFYYRYVLQKRGDLRNRVAFVVPPQPGARQISKDITTQLKIWPTSKGNRVRREEFDSMKKAILEAIHGLYNFVETQNQFPGSDIWIWFRDSAQGYFKQDARNYIICLSDGYLDFDNHIQKDRPKVGNRTSYIPDSQVDKFREIPTTWKSKFRDEGHGLLEIGKDFSNYNVKFLMVEIAHRHMLDLEIVKEYWRTWLKSMGIADSQFLPIQDDPQIVIERIKEFILTE